MGTWSGDDDGGGVKVIWSVFGGGEDHANNRKQVEGQHAREGGI